MGTFSGMAKSVSTAYLFGMRDNLLNLGLTCFFPHDCKKSEAPARKVRMMGCWCWSELIAQHRRVSHTLYSGDQVPTPCALCRVLRMGNDTYFLQRVRDDVIANAGNNISTIIDVLPNDFHYPKYMI